ncbi:hypothetical protein CYY_002960 [Polysphondylium violaceum]|uniref:FNIP repeat-containing protein n=1 Tax=Polysphondylium violaceum TaxID=133409 RepID=A0A8J4Q0E7_9MYCE|nr:hypothetical protein CYY_002960 [Polysphondylium violaceum]
MVSQTLFFAVWRDRYVRKIITNQRVKNSIIRLSASYLDENFSFLSLLDTKCYNIIIQYVTETNDMASLEEYLNHPHRELVNSINILCSDSKDLLRYQDLFGGIDTLLQFQVVFDGGPFELKILPPSVTDLTLRYRGEWTFYRGTFPLGLKKLELQRLECEFDGPSVGVLPDSISDLTVRNYTLKLPERLPLSLVRLDLSWVRVPEGHIVNIPETLEDLVLEENMRKFSSYKIPKGKVFKDMSFRLYDKEQCDQLALNPCVRKVNIQAPTLIPYVPQSINSIYLSSGSDQENQQIIDNNKDRCAFSENLTSLKWRTLDSPFGHGFFPNSLKVLNLGMFNQPLTPGLLPASLIELKLGSYDQPITSVGVIPRGVQKLTIRDLSKVSPKVLPNSLTHVEISPYDLIVPKDVLPASVTVFQAVFQNLPTIYLPAPLGQNIYLPPSITDLDLYLNFYTRSSLIDANQFLKANTIPPHVKSLRLVFIHIDGMVPDGCQTLTTNMYQDLPDVQLPPSLTHLSLQDEVSVKYCPPSVKLLSLPQKSTYDKLISKKMTVFKNHTFYVHKSK